MNLKNIPQFERPREKALKNGIENLSDGELIAILLQNGTKGVSVLELANQLLVHFGGLNALLKADLNELIHIKGIHQVKALELKVCYELANRLNQTQEHKKKITITCAKDVYDRYHLQATNYCQEVFYVLFLNIKLQIVKEEKMFVGGSEASYVDVNLLFKKAMQWNAKKIICFHNHPSGDATPSSADILLTQRMIELGDFLQIKVLDHLVLGKNQYYSIIEKKQYFIDSSLI